MVQKGMRGLTIVRPVRYNKGTKFEKVVREEFHISVNAAIPFTHKDFQPQTLGYQEEKAPKAVKKADKAAKKVASKFSKGKQNFKPQAALA